MRHLETNALSQFVVTNETRFFVSRDRSGDVYYMTFTSLAPAPPTVVSPRNADKKVDKDKEDKRGTNSTAPGDVSNTSSIIGAEGNKLDKDEGQSKLKPIRDADNESDVIAQTVHLIKTKASFTGTATLSGTQPLQLLLQFL